MGQLMDFETLQLEIEEFEVEPAVLPVDIAVNRVAENVSALRDVTTEQERGNWSHVLTRLPEAWSRTMGEGVRVAVLDTGVDPDHPDLEAAIVASEDFTGDGIEDINGHGTHCAGIVGARLDGEGFVGIAPRCELIIGKVLGNNGSGSFRGIAEGVDWAVDQGAHIISMSLGGPVSSPLLYRSIATALARGVHIICAAGNSGNLFRNSIGFPGQYGGVITVASHDRYGNPSGFSSRGGELDFMAPGSDIWSTYKDGGYAELSGTSMATPYVAGVSALILSKHLQKPIAEQNTPIFNCADLRAHLLAMAAHPGYHDSERGYGPLLPFMTAQRGA